MNKLKPTTKTHYWVYILLCDNESYYTGYTPDLSTRYHAHITGTGRCKYTRSFKPIMIAQCWQIIGDKSLALQMERHIKRLSREQKTEIIMYPTRLSDDPRIKTISKRLRLQMQNRSRQ